MRPRPSRTALRTFNDDLQESPNAQEHDGSRPVRSTLAHCPARPPLRTTRSSPAGASDRCRSAREEEERRRAACGLAAVGAWVQTVRMPREVVHQLLATDVGARQARSQRHLGRGGRATAAERARSAPESAWGTRARQAPAARWRDGWRSSADPGVERTSDQAAWLIMTGWASTDAERRLLEVRR